MPTAKLLLQCVRECSPSTRGRGSHSYFRDITGVYFSEASASGADFRVADLTAAKLSGVKAADSDLLHATLDEVNVDRLSAPRGDVSITTWRLARGGALDLTGANFTSATVRDATLGVVSARGG